MANAEVQRLLISFPVRGMMSRGDYIYFNIVTAVLSPLPELTLNSVAKSLTSDLPPGSYRTAKRVTPPPPRIRLNCAAQT